MENFDKLTGIAAPLPLVNIDTDMIIPKQFLKTIKRSGLGVNLFDEMRYDDDGAEIPDFVLNKPQYREAQILIAGDNFGCGSSREHAPWAIKDFGIRCIIAPSFADIFHSNCFKNGILPITLPAEQVRHLRTLAERGRRQSALDQFQRVLEARPEDARALYAGALVALERGDKARARGWLERLVSLGQRTDAAHYYLGRIAEDEGDYAEARDRYSRTGGSYDHQAQIRLALMAADGGAVGEAIERLERLRSNNPDTRLQAWQAQGQLLRDAGRIEAAIEAYDQGLEVAEDNVDLLYARAMTRIQAGDIEAAISDLRAVLDQDPDNAHALNALGYTLANNTDRYAEAEELIRKAYAQLPEDPAVIDSMGWIAYKQGRLQAAERYLRQAYDLSGQAEIAAHLGEVLWQRDKRDAARQVWNEALQAHPNAETITETMERLSP